MQKRLIQLLIEKAKVMQFSSSFFEIVLSPEDSPKNESNTQQSDAINDTGDIKNMIMQLHVTNQSSMTLPASIIVLHMSTHNRKYYGILLVYLAYMPLLVLM